MADAVAVPGYLTQTYWWAYIHPRAVRLFEREWLVNLILWGNFGRLCDAALTALAPGHGRVLQIACVYGDLTRRLAEAAPGRLDVVDVLPIQPMVAVLRGLEPFALDLWRRELADWLPAGAAIAALGKRTFFGGLYQLVTIEKAIP